MNERNHFFFFKMCLLGKAKYLTPGQTQTLMKKFQNKHYLDKEEKHQLANLLKISEKKVEKWFIDKRSQRRQPGLRTKSEEY